MQGHQYVALRRLTCQDGARDNFLIVNPGETIPSRITDTWPAPAIRAMVNVGHIQFAKIQETGTLPYLKAQEQAEKAAARTVVDQDLPPPAKAPAAKAKTKAKTVKVKAA